MALSLQTNRALQPRDYQRRALDLTYEWFAEHDTGNPCVVMPTGSGKSLVISMFAMDALTNWPETRILVLAHVKELLIQNAEKLATIWPSAPFGMCSASIGQRNFHEPITFAGIQTIWKHAGRVGHVDIVIVDEAHSISHTATGQYRTFLAELQAINPALRVVGFTATPYRLGHGMIHEGEDALFCDLIEPVSIADLIEAGHLAPLRSKLTDQAIDVSGVAKRGGEFVAGDLERAVDKSELTSAIVAETLRRAEHCRHMLFFCTGVDHAEHMADELRANGVAAECVHGGTPAGARAQYIDGLRTGRLRALTNANVLTTGTDIPAIDCVVFARPTLSPGLYVQMAGRGMRIKQHADHCLVLDFAGNVARHGPITSVIPPSRRRKGEGDAPTKSCPECSEIMGASARQCPACGFVFPVDPKPPEPIRLHNDDIMGIAPSEMRVTGWRWRKHVSRTSGKPMLAVTYYGGLVNDVTEYIAVTHEGMAGNRARHTVAHIARNAGVVLAGMDDDALTDVAAALTAGNPPEVVKYRREGKFFRVEGREFATLWSTQDERRPAIEAV